MSTPPFVQPYLIFDGHCADALMFYQRAVGATVGMLMRYRDAPEPPPPEQVSPGYEDKVMHAEFTIGSSTLLASDNPCHGQSRPGGGFSLSLNLATETEADACFAALSDGAEIIMPLAPTFWSPRFGMLTDRFGLGWMINVTAPATA
ncbi:VOC family protein [Flagellatimonas centrodinii]|uniref:VOC family protein n=1 Tax=Flagellatimonas centrodinii TaxID=2806210 RepID=UPI001FEFDCE9|nr:VOC family protein [Flagellatimonas centrodinii]ULQ47917.1 VOC family protein [Flagellatimonas centrodinii]